MMKNPQNSMKDLKISKKNSISSSKKWSLTINILDKKYKIF